MRRFAWWPTRVRCLWLWLEPYVSVRRWHAMPGGGFWLELDRELPEAYLR